MDGDLAFFDFGPDGNAAAYGSPKPPAYDLRQVAESGAATHQALAACFVSRIAWLPARAHASTL